MARDGCAFVKMKVGTHPDDDPRRVAVAKAAIGEATLFVDANGAYSVKQSLTLAQRISPTRMSAGSRSLSLPMICGSCGSSRARSAGNGNSRRRIRLHGLIMCARCWKPVRWTCSKPM